MKICLWYFCTFLQWREQREKSESVGNGGVRASKTLIIILPRAVRNMYDCMCIVYAWKREWNIQRKSHSWLYVQYVLCICDEINSSVVRGRFSLIQM